MADLEALVRTTCDENKGPLLLSVTWTLQTIAIITVTTRIYFRCGVRNGINADDYTIVASLVRKVPTPPAQTPSANPPQIAGIAGVGSLTNLIFNGLGRHIYCLSPSQIPQVFKWSIIAQLFNILGIGLVKVSVCLTVLRIIDRTRRSVSLFLWLLIAFATFSHCTQVLLFLIQCRPMSALWNPHIHGRCFSSHITYLAGYIGFGLDAFTDLVTAGIPIFIINRLQMNNRTKLALCGLMGLGALTAACAIAKAVTLQGVFSRDYTWGLTKPAICTIIEHLVGMVLVSLPALRPLYKKVLDVAASPKGSGFTPHSSRRSSRPTSRWTPAVSVKGSMPTASHKSDDTEQTAVPMKNGQSITKTISFRLSSHNSVCERDEYWPLPPESVQSPGWLDGRWEPIRSRIGSEHYDAEKAVLPPKDNETCERSDAARGREGGGYRHS